VRFDDYLSAIEGSGSRLSDLVAEAGHEAPVPTCPAWSARSLLAHQAMVHRWAASHVTGLGQENVPTQTYLRDEADDLPGYYREGLANLVSALRVAPPDLKAMRFLHDAPPARQFWARRQAHETTIHMVDALAAALGRLPTAADAQVSADLAADGVDELLGGFLPRGRSKLYSGTEETVVVSSNDTGHRWLLRVGESNVTERDPEESAADFVISGTAAELYLGLWNRGDEIAAPAEFLARWRSAQRVRWS
jgi:uncharacterized protein (TIGR03083 family)